jgi:pimeloyl-ACP methyl ester carboxylesterase
MTTFRGHSASSVQTELEAAKNLEKRGDSVAAFRHLERAHILGQNSTRQHLRVHWRMLLWGIKQRNVREIAGQLFRMAGAATKTAFGLVPQGNTGGANVSPFRSMPVPEDLAVLLAKDVKPSWFRWAPAVFFGTLVLTAASLLSGTTRHGDKVVLVDGHRVTFRVIGTGRPAVVMISGLGDGMATFDDVAAELGKTRTVIIYDRAGYGGSAAGSGPRDAVAAERELSGVLAQSGVADPFVLSGHSLGGLFAEYYAARHPDQIAGLILEESRPANFTRVCEAALRGGLCVPPEWMVWFMAKGARDEASALPDVMKQVEGVVPLMNKPVLVLSRPGKVTEETSFDTVWTKAQSDLAARYPGSRHLTADAGGHYLHQDQREWFLTSVQAFLGQLRLS